MKIKVLSILLCICMLIPCFTILGFAEGGEVVNASSSTEDIYVPEDLYQMIDVQAYIDNAGQAGYDNMKLLGFSVPYVYSYNSGNDNETMNRVTFTAYFYNPDLYPICISPLDPDVDGSCYPYYWDELSHNHCLATVNGEHAWTTAYGSDNDHYHSYNSMFFGLSFSQYYTTAEYEEIASKGMEYPVNEISFYIYLGERLTDGIDAEHGNRDGDYSNDDFEKLHKEVRLDLNTKVYFQDIDGILGFSSVYTDLPAFLNIDIDTLNKEYPKKPDYSEITPAFLYEDMANKRLFLYMYDSRGRGAVNNSVNRVSLSTDNSNFESYYLHFINFENTLSKFEIKGVSDLFANVSTDSARTYYINEVVYDRVIGSFGVTNDEVKYTYSNLTTFSGESSADTYVESESNLIRLVDVRDTSYRLNSSITGEGYYQTLSSVYFSIPESYFELDDMNFLNDREITRINGSYYWAFTNPGVITNNHDYYVKLYKDLIDGNIDSTYLNTDKIAVGPGNYIISDGIVPENTYRTLSYLYESPWRGGRSTETEEFIKVPIDKKTIKTLLANSASPFSSEFQKKDFEFTPKDVFELVSRKEMTFEQFYLNYGLFNAFWRFLFGESSDVMNSLKNIKLFVSLSGEELNDAINLPEEKFIETYLINQYDYKDVVSKMKTSYDNGEVFILFRYDTYDYYCDYIEVNNMVKMDDAYLVIDKFYKDFEIMEMELSNFYSSKVYQIDMKPISIISGVWGADPFDPEEDLNTPSESINKGEGAVGKIVKDKGNSFLMVIGIILIIVFAIVVSKYVIIPIIRTVRKE
ncbi:MAG: hypothetical protein J6L90_02290 [Clostridia bacterium]|nr:hypothetical protein [Clostridia bacterium]